MSTDRKPSQIKQCLVCGEPFRAYHSKIVRGRAKYCSRNCSNKVTLIKPGQHLSPETEIKGGEPLPKHIRDGQNGKKPWNDKGYTDAGLDYRKKRVGGRNYREHRLVVEKYLGRRLNSKEVVHHVNGKKSDNRIENLWVFANDSSHIKHHRGKPYPKCDLVFKGGDAPCRP